MPPFTGGFFITRQFFPKFFVSKDEKYKVTQMDAFMNIRVKTNKEIKVIKKCHCCGEIIESIKEEKKCFSCGKAFLPLNYFTKIHTSEDYQFNDLFDKSEDLHEEDLIKGLQVLW